MFRMISVDEAVARIVAAFAPLEAETVAIGKAAGRVLARRCRRASSISRRSPVSSMDGYAVRAADAAKPGATLDVVGAAPAVIPSRATSAPGEAVRIFTGGVVPDGADAIVIQEDAQSDGDRVSRSTSPPTPGRHIRVAGLDFKAGEVLGRDGPAPDSARSVADRGGRLAQVDGAAPAEDRLRRHRRRTFAARRRRASRAASSPRPATDWRR